MSTTFIDTSYLLAILLSDDQHHERALGWQRHRGGPFVTTEYVLVEVFDALCAPRVRQFALAGLDVLRSNPSVHIVPASTELFDRAADLFRRRADKAWGLTDCILFVVMQDLGSKEALTFDRHFEQAGFRALLRHEPGAGN